jgi:hypothetical protein
MSGFRYVDSAAMRRLATGLDQCSTDLNLVARRLTGFVEATPVGSISGYLGEAARTVLRKASAADPELVFTVAPAGPFETSITSPPTLDRLFAANRRLIWEEIWRVVDELNRLSALDVQSGPMTSGLQHDYNALALLAGMDVVHFSIDASSAPGTRSGRAGYRAGVWIGPRDADHVVFMIPGMNTTTRSWLERNVPDGRRLQETAAELAECHGRGTVAVVPLLTYDPPQTFLDAPLAHFWRDGSRTTADVLATLPLEGRHVTGWGHSYGAVVLGATSAAGTPFDDLIMVGAAGTGTESLEELGVDADHLHVATNWNDPIRLVPNDYHGVNPAALPHTPVPTSPAIDFDPWKAVLGLPWFLLDGLPDHEYLNDPVAMRAFAAITIGLDYAEP